MTHLVGTLLRHEIRFSMPDDFDLGEIRIAEEIGVCTLESMKAVDEATLRRMRNVFKNNAFVGL